MAERGFSDSLEERARRLASSEGDEAIEGGPTEVVRREIALTVEEMDRIRTLGREHGERLSWKEAYTLTDLHAIDPMEVGHLAEMSRVHGQLKERLSRIETERGTLELRTADPLGLGPIPSALALSQNAPNPAIQNTLIRYSLPVEATVNLTLFDLQGRHVATLLSNVPQAAGPHEVSLSTGAVRPGFYLYRLDAGGQSATRKMIVLR